MKAGETVKANTPYVVKPTTNGEISLTLESTSLHKTQAGGFSKQSASDEFTFCGLYEKTTKPTDAIWYALNTKGEFQKLGDGVYLTPFRIFMTIAPREDNPYATEQTESMNAKFEIVVLGDDTTGIEEVSPKSSPEGKDLYNLRGQKVRSIQKGGVYLVGGRKYIAQ